mgnify:CR=1 FL=1
MNNANNIRNANGLLEERALVARLRNPLPHRLRPPIENFQEPPPPPPPIPIELEEAVLLSWRLSGVWLRILWSLGRGFVVNRWELVRRHEPGRPPERRHSWEEPGSRNPPPMF